MDLVTLSAIAAIVGTLIALINLLFGQKGVIERWREKKRGHKEETITLLRENVHHSNDIQVSESGKMFALVKEHNGPGLTLTTKPIPSIRSNEVLIKVLVTSICGSDLHIYHWRDSVNKRIQVPRIVGHEFCGVIVKCGKDVSEFKVGEFIAAESHISCGKCTYCQKGQSNVCPNIEVIGFERDGAFAEYISIPAGNIWRLPKEMSPEVATLLEPFGNSVHAALSHDLVNQTVLITGAGSIGLMAIAICKWARAKQVISTDVREYRLELAKKVGADFTFNANKQNSTLEKMIMEATKGRGVNVLLEMSGSEKALELGLNVLRNAGHAVLMGIYKDKVSIDLNNLVTYKGVTIYGRYGRLSDAAWERMRNLVGTGEVDIKPVITHTYRLDEFNKAFWAVESGEAGKVLIYPTVGKDTVLPIEFKPTATDSELPTMLEHSPYNQRVSEIILTGNEKKLDILEEELNDYYSTADRLQKIISASRKSLLSSTRKVNKSNLSKKIGEYEQTKAEILKRCEELVEQINRTRADIETNQINEK